MTTNNMRQTDNFDPNLVAAVEKQVLADVENETNRRCRRISKLFSDLDRLACETPEIAALIGQRLGLRSDR